MIYFNKNIRSHQPEIMDELDLQGDEMKILMNDLKIVNRWLGGNKITLDGLKVLLKNHPKSEKITIVDFGCGDGEMLRQCAKFGKKNGYNFDCIGIDFNSFILGEAIAKSKSFPNVQFQTKNVFSEVETLPECDIALTTLFLHHFKNEQIESLLKKILDKTTIGLIVNDLQRSKLAFNLFKIASNIFLKTEVARYDGLVSVARGFRKKELENLSQKITTESSIINWRWAFRYQWIINKSSSNIVS